MDDVKPKQHARRTLSDLVRSLVYPVVPILGIMCVWAYAYAGSLESKIRRDLQPRGQDAYYIEAAKDGELHYCKRTFQGTETASLDEQN